MARKAAVGGADFGPEEIAKLLTVLGVLGTFGMVPTKWKRAIGVAGALYTLWLWLQ